MGGEGRGGGDRAGEEVGGRGGEGMRRRVQSLEKHGERAKSKRGGLERGDVTRRRSRTQGAMRWYPGAADDCLASSHLAESMPTSLSTETPT